MTSANVTEYRIESKEGNHIITHRQNWLCETHWEDLIQYANKGYTITPFGYDEDDEYWEDEPQSLDSFLNKLLKK